MHVYLYTQVYIYIYMYVICVCVYMHIYFMGMPSGLSKSTEKCSESESQLLSLTRGCFHKLGSLFGYLCNARVIHTKVSRSLTVSGMKTWERRGRKAAMRVTVRSVVIKSTYCQCPHLGVRNSHGPLFDAPCDTNAMACPSTCLFSA